MPNLNIENVVTITNVTGVNLRLLTVSGPAGPAGPSGSSGASGAAGVVSGVYPILYNPADKSVAVDTGYFALYSQLLTVSGFLEGKIVLAGGVTGINGISGAVTIASANGNIFIQNVGSTIFISGSGIANSGDVLNILSLLASSGANLYNLLVNASGQLSANPSGYITTGQTGQFYPASNPNGFATSGNLVSTSGALHAALTGASGQAVSDYIRNIAATGFVTGILTGFDNQYIWFPFSFSRTPEINLTMWSQNVVYSFAYDNPSPTGFSVSFSDIIAETGVFLSVWASI